ncbi:copper resistance CopC/CopD family protein [Paenibacillus sp. HJGM_3]|uniref:copper resistance CopC/CopD family protein n=1 Tax=Paenibacillus sp. HJGM_3 TaxID=3379816 RepID=UPI00385B3524
MNSWKLTRKGWGRIAVLLIAFFALSTGMLGQAQPASAHSILIKAEPEPNTRLDVSPEQIVLTFNERLETELYYIKLFDEVGREPLKEKATLSQDQKVMTLRLPKLDEGRYTVSYHVISADGHPVEGAYVLVIGQASDGGTSTGSGESLHAGHGGLSADMSLTDLLRYVFRIVYYFSLLTLAGVAFWGMWLRKDVLPQTGALSYYAGWLLSLQRVYLISLLAFIYFHYKDLLGDQGADQLVSLFTGTWVGRSWIASLVLALLGFVVLARHKVLDCIWIGLLLLAKSWNGHAMGYDPQWLMVLLDWLHLIAAAIWAGGLLLLVSAWKSHRAFVDALLPRFSRVALWSLLGLAISGAISVLIYLPSLRYLLYSQWGKLMIAKVVFVVMVVLIAAGIRMAMKKKNDKDLKDYMRLDLAAMAIIVVLVGLLTYISPVPPNEPLYWHEMGEKVHMTAKISPKVPGDNQIQVDVWMLEKTGQPKQVELYLRNKNKTDIAPISVPLQQSTVEKDQSSSDFEDEERYVKYTYKASGPFIPFAGDWELEFRAMDGQDDETVYKNVMRVY